MCANVWSTAFALDATTRAVPTARDVVAVWRPDTLPATSGCDSSDCAYCQALALRRVSAAQGNASTSWSLGKRSRADLEGTAGEAAGAAGRPGEGLCGSCGAGQAGEVAVGCSRSSTPFPRVPSAGTLAAAAGMGAPGRSMWDHALLVEGSSGDQQQQQQQRQALGLPHGGTSAGCSRAGSSTAVCSAGQTQAGAAGGSSSAAGGSGDSSSGSSWGQGWHPRSKPEIDLSELASFQPPEPHATRRAPNTDIVCALEFEERGWLLACAGVAKQVRVYSLASRLQHAASEAYLQPIRCHRMPSKISSLAWNPDAPGAITVGDYDGVVAQVDMESGHLIAEADEHSGRRIWSVSHSVHRPHLCASASDDGTVRLWAGAGMQCCLGSLRPGASGAPACGVALSPFDGNLVAIASADHSCYVFDLRRADRPLLRLAGHSRAVSYVRWLGPASLATASVDASLALWQLPGFSPGSGNNASDAAAGINGAAAAAAAAPAAGAAGAAVVAPWKQLRGHRNGKNFCGLSVRPGDGLVACGSEDPAAFVYHRNWTSPAAVHKFAAEPAGSSAQQQFQQQQQQGPGQQQGLFCSAVAWQPAAARPGRPPVLAAALSSGELRVLELQRPAVNQPAAGQCAGS